MIMGINSFSRIPIFDEIESLYLQSLLTVGLVCDVFPSAMRNLKN
jgi:hypothetical protein